MLSGIGILASYSVLNMRWLPTRVSVSNDVHKSRFGKNDLSLIKGAFSSRVTRFGRVLFLKKNQSKNNLICNVMNECFSISKIFMSNLSWVIYEHNLTDLIPVQFN